MKSTNLDEHAHFYFCLWPAVHHIPLPTPPAQEPTCGARGQRILFTVAQQASWTGTHDRGSWAPGVSMGAGQLSPRRRHATARARKATRSGHVAFAAPGVSGRRLCSATRDPRAPPTMSTGRARGFSFPRSNRHRGPHARHGMVRCRNRSWTPSTLLFLVVVCDHSTQCHCSLNRNELQTLGRVRLPASPPTPELDPKIVFKKTNYVGSNMSNITLASPVPLFVLGKARLQLPRPAVLPRVLAAGFHNLRLWDVMNDQLLRHDGHDELHDLRCKAHRWGLLGRHKPQPAVRFCPSVPFLRRLCAQDPSGRHVQW